MWTRVWVNCDGVEVFQKSAPVVVGYAGSFFSSWAPFPFRMIHNDLTLKCVFEGEAPPSKDTVRALRTQGARGASILEEEGRKLLAQGRYPWWFLDAAAPPPPPRPHPHAPRGRAPHAPATAVPCV